VLETRTDAWCCSRRACQTFPPRIVARLVEPTMSVKRIVAGIPSPMKDAAVPSFREGGGRHQPWHKERVLTTEERQVAKLINRECGQVVRGETDDELITNAEEHVRRDHPELVGKISREDFLGMAEEA
jgi:predicted small metal-binding protein